MSKMEQIASINKTAAKSAAFMEAGRIANNQVAKIAAKKLPVMIRGYADTPFGKLVIANAAIMAIEHLRPEDQRAKALARAMAVQAYQEAIQTLDIEGLLEELFSNKSVSRAMENVGDE